ncbi:hypothetical protein PIB30_021293 [Stylosanthes scabra]|uniref:Zinc finger protein 598 n=1 Tax=Stylosanthes scabra TaxID=79078 RepID=A0ABU6Y8F9_9FABA|nr:hypothetical protein [Stylosanthes scabra]
MFQCRQHPGQYEYYKNYDDLEIHFRNEHFLCEDEACLAKKFIVFQSESEMKRHNAIEHGGRMSRSQRNAALQIPTSFRYRRNDQDQRRGRGRSFRRDFSENQLSMAIEASLQMANAAQTLHDPSTSSSGYAVVDDGNADVDSIVQPFESLATSGSEASARYLQALGPSSRNAALVESSFPPLPLASSNDQQRSKQESEGSSSNTMVARLRRHGNRNVSVINSGNAWPAPGRGRLSGNSSQARLQSNVAPGVPHISGQMKTANSSGPSPSTYASSIQPTSRTAHAQSSVGSSRDTRDNGRMVHSASAPNLIESNPIEASISDFPPVSAALVSKSSASTQTSLNVENVQSANKSLVEKIRGALDFDEDRYTLFKDLSGQYRQGTIDTETYLDYVQQFGLSHLVPEMANLLPDAQKKEELIASYNRTLQRKALPENGWARGSSGIPAKDSNASKKGKGKSVDGSGNSTNRLADSFLSTVHQLQSSYKSSEENLEVLSRGDYRTSKGKSKISQQIDTNSGNQPLRISGQTEASGGGLSNQKKEDAGAGSKQRKKSSKFLRVRLGDGSASALLDFDSSHTEPDPGTTDTLPGNKNDNGGPPVRGVWRKGGGQRLFN